MARMRIGLEGDAPTRPIGHPASCWKDQLPNSEFRIPNGEKQNESLRSIILSPKKAARNTSRRRNFVTHLTSSEHMKNAKQSHGRKQKPATKVPEKRNKKPQARETCDTDRISSESDDDTLCVFFGIARRSPLSTLKGDWIQYEQCRIQYREKCVAAGRRKMFTRGKCNIQIALRPTRIALPFCRKLQFAEH
jgi:hypothetical protein